MLATELEMGKLEDRLRRLMPVPPVNCHGLDDVLNDMLMEDGDLPSCGGEWRDFRQHWRLTPEEMELAPGQRTPLMQARMSWAMADVMFQLRRAWDAEAAPGARLLVLKGWWLKQWPEETVSGGRLKLNGVLVTVTVACAFKTR